MARIFDHDKLRGGINTRQRAQIFDHDKLRGGINTRQRARIFDREVRNSRTLKGIIKMTM